MSGTTEEQTKDSGRKRGRVKWYNDRRGYGFIEVDGHEVFIHRSTLTQFGILRIQNEDIVIVTEAKTERGYIVEHLFGIERPPLPDWLYADAPAEGEEIAEIKFFNDDKGYGFVMVDGREQDIFIHSRTLENNRITGLDSGQKVLVKISEDENGPVIDTIRFYRTDDPVVTEPKEQPPIGNRASDSEPQPRDQESHLAHKKFYDLTSKGS